VIVIMYVIAVRVSHQSARRREVDVEVSNRRQSFRGLGVGLLVFGAVLFVGAAWVLVHHVILSGHGIETEGEIVGSRSVHAAKAGTRYVPRFEFEDTQGNRHQVESRLMHANQPEAGTPVRVLYDPNDPGDAEILDFRFWGNPILLFVTAAALAGGGTWLLRR